MSFEEKVRSLVVDDLKLDDFEIIPNGSVFDLKLWCGSYLELKNMKEAYGHVVSDVALHGGRWHICANIQPDERLRQVFRKLWINPNEFIHPSHSIAFVCKRSGIKYSSGPKGLCGKYGQEALANMLLNEALMDPEARAVALDYLERLEALMTEAWGKEAAKRVHSLKCTVIDHQKGFYFDHQKG